MAWLHAVIDVPEHQLVASASFWGQALAWPAGRAWSGHPELRSFEPPTGTAYVHLQQVDGPSRVHLDVEVEDVVVAVGRTVALGASHVAAHDRWQTMRSPGGLPFCFVPATVNEVPVRRQVAPRRVTPPAALPVSRGGGRLGARAPGPRD